MPKCRIVLATGLAIAVLWEMACPAMSQNSARLNPPPDRIGPDSAERTVRLPLYLGFNTFFQACGR